MSAQRALVQQRIDSLIRDFPPTTTDVVPFMGAQFDLGLAWVHLPEGQGGCAVSPELQEMVDTQLRAAGAPRRPEECFIGVGMQAPTIAHYGTPEQRQHVRRIFTSEELWCQLFSEPGAGSDIAGLASTAKKVDGGWLVNGQKVWTSWAHRAQWGQLLVRTDPNVPKHKGITCLMLDMSSPGVDVRPLFQMSGEAEFNEVYMTDVFVPDDCLLGEVGRGWKVAITTLMQERVSLGALVPPTGLDTMRGTATLWERTPVEERDPVTRDRMVQLWMRAEMASMTVRRAVEAGKAGTPGPEGSIAKLVFAELRRDLSEFNLEVLGMEGLIYEAGFARQRATSDSLRTNEATFEYMRSRAATIEGGTSEIMRNILGERVLGLPEEPRVDKTLPWREVKRG